MESLAPIAPCVSGESPLDSAPGSTLGGILVRDAIVSRPRRSFGNFPHVKLRRSKLAGFVRGTPIAGKWANTGLCPLVVALT